MLYEVITSWMYGTVNEQTIKLSEIISKAVPVAEKIRYVTSGTEATMYAVRLARSVITSYSIHYTKLYECSEK